eukprot:scaffold10022_cov156-Skeletonema_marinoi.AAC.4
MLKVKGGVVSAPFYAFSIRHRPLSPSDIGGTFLSFCSRKSAKNDKVCLSLPGKRRVWEILSLSLLLGIKLGLYGRVLVTDRPV